MKFQFLLLLSSCILLSACQQTATSTSTEESVTTTPAIRPILLNATNLSGLDLKAVKDPNQPDRQLFQQRLYRGRDISVYIVSSESATADHESYGIDEFIYLINGGARIKAQSQSNQYFYTGDFFIAPKGYVGEWETIGATNYHHELSVISTDRNKSDTDPDKRQALLIDKKKLSGIGISRTSDQDETYQDVIYQGHELTISIEAEPSSTKTITEPLPEQLIYVIAGSVELTDSNEDTQSFFAGDFFILPDNFTGQWESKGHHLFRSMRVVKANW